MLRLSLVAVVAFSAGACGSDDASVDPKAGECEDYCDLIDVHCGGAVLQYSDRNACLSTCHAMPLGDATTHAGNTIMCRTFAAATAELAPADTCAEAGPGGDGVCGSNCESFCQIQSVICTGDNQAYASEAECMTACAGFATTPPYDASKTAGNTLACRIYHLTAAANDPITHCHHLVPSQPVDVMPRLPCDD